MNPGTMRFLPDSVSAGCHINDVMNVNVRLTLRLDVSDGCHINDVMNLR